MKIKLIMPAWPKSSLWGKLGSGIPSLSLATIAALTPPGHDIEIIYDEKGPINYDAPCDIVGITGMTPVSKRAYKIAAEFKKRGVLTVMGGIHATMAPEEAGEHFDCVIVG
ncbi:MAG TPA: radical SAM protein, partial [Nitrospirota bacterium]